MLGNVLAIQMLPLIAFILIVFFTKKYKFLSACISLAAAAISALLSIIVLVNILSGRAPVEVSINWLDIPTMGAIKGLNIEMGLLIDPLSSLMLVIVTFVAFLVILYSFEYMKGDEGYSRYFAYISLFTFSMLGLVVSSNFFQIFVFWELVGLCSYLLIGFWFHKKSASDASKKAFITNRWADFGFMIGIILLFIKYGTFNFNELIILVAANDLPSNILIAALIFMGPIGKSAQFPLHVWLPDAMEGPTPVSALIHAATMVAAGVFLIARSFVIFEGLPHILTAMAYIGGFTSVFAAVIAITQDDIKKILAFSTLSQLGYMIMAMGMGNITAGMFHLTTHAFFKALLFLGAGSIIHALDNQNIFKMGGLKEYMPLTCYTFITGSLALSGIFPLAGFWSKDEILSTALKSGHTGLYILGTFVAFLTSFYMFRMIFTAFFGKKRSDYHAHEGSIFMKLPLVLLSVLSVITGFVNSPWFYNAFNKSFGTFIFYKEAEMPDVDITVAAVSTFAALFGIFLAWLMYRKEVIHASAIKKKWKGLYNLIYNRFYIDNLYAFLFEKVMLGAGRAFDVIEHKLIDGVFDGFAKTIGFAGKKIRLIQTGYLQSYALVMLSAVVVMAIILCAPYLGGAFK
ncbi:NADH-quinone oxidoreductase subunit L [Oxobacter pfennigii]|uniref:NADH-quinone oxidoreductase subunit L n=1 Tax=Oxobacter pfennigii TaxID=36849 RepID=A0A0P8YGD8_9CLOT|nr:NADH-quinone oxidoreductase subunit L [Oxobacter pfennigii]KPU46095.1 NADH-quinone oxidoreductase subunit L [Oxobacter pfennigii]